MTKVKNFIKNRMDLFEVALISIFPLVYLLNISNHFWALPAAGGDSLEYLGGVRWGTTYMFFPWLDRITLATNLRITSFFCDPSYLAGPVYILAIHLIMLTMGLVWVYRQSGFIASVCLGVFWNTAYVPLAFSTFVYADQTVALYSLGAFMIMFYGAEKRGILRLVLCGILCGFALTSKITGIGTLLFFLLWCLWEKNVLRFLWVLAGVVIGIMLAFLLYSLVYNFESLVCTIRLFFGSKLIGNITINRNNLVSHTKDVLLSLSHFPFVCLFMLPGAYRYEKTKHLLGLTWVFIIFLACIFAFTPRGGEAKVTYLYTAFIINLIAVSLYIGDISGNRSVKRNTSSAKIINAEKILWVGLILTCLYIGFYIAINMSPYKVGIADITLPPVSIFQPLNAYASRLPLFVKIFYTLGPIAVLLLLIASLCEMPAKKNRWVYLMVPVVALWGAAYCGGIAYRVTEDYMRQHSIAYEVAPFLNKVSSKRFAVFLDERKAYCLPWIYHSFIDNRRIKRGYDNRLRSYKELMNDVAFFTKEEELLEMRDKGINPRKLRNFYMNAEKIQGFELSIPAFKPVNIILTDKPEIVQHIWKNAETINTFETNDFKLYEMNLFATKNRLVVNPNQ